MFQVVLSISLVTTLVFANLVNTEESTENPYSLENMTFSFNCSDKAVGFYADREYNCQIFHMCDADGTRIPHTCANETSFNQEFRICDWEYNFDCSQAENWYYLNNLTYITDPPIDEEDLK